MSRKPRFCAPNLSYHLFSRCVNQEDIMKDDRNKDLMMTVLQETQQKYTFELLAFTILPNHFHFVIKTLPNGETVSKIMQRIKSVFAKRYNRLHNRTGPLWNERFGSVIIEHTDDPTKYLLYLLWYLAYNPIRKNIVNDPREYRYGSINCYLDKRYSSKLKITLHDAFMNLGKTFSERVKAFLPYEAFYVERLWFQRWGP